MKGGRILLASVLFALLATPSWTGTTGQLIGFVVGETGTPLRDASVSAKSPSQVGAAQFATTEINGSFRFPRLAPGYYTVIVESAGHIPKQLEHVQVRLDHTTNIHVSLSEVAFAADIEVNELTPMVDPAQVSTGQTFTTEYMTETRTDWRSLITQTPGASQSFRRVMGSTPQDNAYLLDGMDSTNWFQRYPNLAAADLPFDAVQEVAVHTAGFEAEYGYATGAVVNVTTKSGGNTFSGTVDVRYTSNDFESSGEHYDPDEQESEDTRITGTLGGPILRDNLWFFTTYGRTSIKDTPTGAPTTFHETGDVFLGKLTWHPSSSWSVVGKYSTSLATQDDYGSWHTRAAEATGIFERTPFIASLEAVGVLSDNLLWGLQLSREDWDETGLPSTGGLEAMEHYNLITGNITGSWGSQWYAVSEQLGFSTDLTWFAEAAGSHELKAGLGYSQPEYFDEFCLNGPGGRCTPGVEGFSFSDITDPSGNPIPYFVQVSAAEGPLYYGGDIWKAYLQDAWRVRSNLTLKLGMRWDLIRYDNETGVIAELDKIQPRAGVAWDIASNGRTVLRASWGRFMHPGTLILSSLTNEVNHPAEFWFSCSTLISTDPSECAAFASDEEFGYRSDPEGWDPAGWFLDPANVVFSEPSRTAGDLRAGYADQWIIALERELGRRTAIEFSYVNKTGKDMFDDTCEGNVPDPTPDTGCSSTVVANLPQIKSDYEALMLRFESQAFETLHLLASWVVSDSKGSIDYNTAATGAFDFYPYHFVNRYGHLQDHSRHRVKLNGYWQLPRGFSLAFEGWWESEFRWTVYDRTVPGMPYGSQFVESRGSRKSNDLHQINLQLSKSFKVGPTNLVLLATAVNLTDSQHNTDICGSVTGCGEYALGDAIAWNQPRRYELGFRVEF